MQDIVKEMDVSRNSGAITKIATLSYEISISSLWRIYLILYEVVDAIFSPTSVSRDRDSRQFFWRDFTRPNILSTVKIGIKELLNGEQIDISEQFCDDQKVP